MPKNPLGKIKDAAGVAVGTVVGHRPEGGRTGRGPGGRRGRRRGLRVPGRRSRRPAGPERASAGLRAVPQDGPAGPHGDPVKPAVKPIATQAPAKAKAAAKKAPAKKTARQEARRRRRSTRIRRRRDPCSRRPWARRPRRRKAAATEGARQEAAGACASPARPSRVASGPWLTRPMARIPSLDRTLSGTIPFARGVADRAVRTAGPIVVGVLGRAPHASPAARGPNRRTGVLHARAGRREPTPEVAGADPTTTNGGAPSPSTVARNVAGPRPTAKARPGASRGSAPGAKLPVTRPST